MFKKLASFTLAVILALSLCITAYATETIPSESDATTEPAIQPEEYSTEPTDPPQVNATEPSVTQPTEIPEQTAPTFPAPTAPPIPTMIEIDTEYIYDGMDMAYKDGYMPRIADGKMHLVLPLRTNGDLYGGKIEARLAMDTGSSSPFVVENFCKTFKLEKYIPVNSNEEQHLFLVVFDVTLSAKRINGTYPVTVEISGYDIEGSPVDCDFTVFVTITDGDSGIAKPPAVEKPTAEPVVYIAKTVMEPEEPQAGKEFILTLTLKNSLTTKRVKNMLVTVNTGNVQIDLTEDSNIFPISEIAPGGEAELTLHFKSDPSIPSGKYPLNFSFAYDSNKTLSLSSSDTVVVPIRQPASMELVMPRIPDHVSVGETIPLSFQVINMGRSEMDNVRCVISGFGLVPANTGYIGTMAAGSSDTTEIELYIIALNASDGNENGAQYGNTTGTLMLLFEDESGNPYEQTYTFETVVDRPVVDLSQIQTEPEEEETAGQWWISVTILGGVILAAIGTILITHKRKKRSGTYL